MKKGHYVAEVCVARLTVTGPKKDLKNFKEFAIGDSPLIPGKIRVMSEHKFIPYPEEYKIFDPIDNLLDKEIEKKRNDLLDQFFLEGKERSGSEAYKQIPLYRSRGEEWCIKNWGSHPGIINPKIESESNMKMIYTFYTEVLPVQPLIHRMAMMFPGLSFIYKYDESPYYDIYEGLEGWYGGTVVYRKGVLHKDMYEKRSY